MTTPKETAAKLGFTGRKFPTLETGCAEFSFRLTAPDTILLGLNNVIYTLKRAGPGKHTRRGRWFQFCHYPYAGPPI